MLEYMAFFKEDRHDRFSNSPYYTVYPSCGYGYPSRYCYPYFY